MSQTQLGPDRRSTFNTPPGTPGWVKVFGLIAAALIVLFVIMHLAGGLSNHMSPIEHRVQQPTQQPSLQP